MDVISLQYRCQGYKTYIDDGSVPAQNVEEARKLKDSLGQEPLEQRLTQFSKLKVSSFDRSNIWTKFHTSSDQNPKSEESGQKSRATYLPLTAERNLEDEFHDYVHEDMFLPCIFHLPLMVHTSVWPWVSLRFLPENMKKKSQAAGGKISNGSNREITQRNPIFLKPGSQMIFVLMFVMIRH